MPMTRIKEISPIVKTVGENIARIIKDKKLKVRNIAPAADLDEQALRRYMKGKQIMGIDKAHKIALALGVEIGELFK